MISFAVTAVLSLGLAAAGALTARRSVPAATAAAACMLALIVLKVVAGYVPAAEPRLFPWNWYPFVETYWFLAPGGFLIGAGLYAARKSVFRRDAVMVLGGLLAVHSTFMAWPLTSNHERLRGRIDAGGVCRQTSDYSCAPAAAVMFLGFYGVRSTEREMAELCVTRSGSGGTTHAGLLRGVRLKMPGRDVRIAAPSIDALPTPSLVSVEFNRWVAHALLVVRAGPDGVDVIDPLGGRRRSFTRSAFERKWQGAAIYVEGGHRVARDGIPEAALRQ